MKILKPILYCLLGAILAFAVMYFINNKEEKQEVIIDKDIPIVELQVTPSDVYIGDSVTYTVKSRVESDNEDFENNRAFYYDFNGDGERDLVSKNDVETYRFLEYYEEGITPRVAVEYRGKLGFAEGNTIYIREKIVPNLLYNSIGNKVIFRDISQGTIIEREICFEASECEIGNTKYKKVWSISIDDVMSKQTITPTTKDDTFVFDYDNYGSHKVLISLKDKYGNEIHERYSIRTSDKINDEKYKIGSGINIITIPETNIINGNPQISLTKEMNNILVMYINNDSGETCYVDKDISRDSDGDGKTDNDIDVLCNKMVKFVYEPDYINAIGKIYFISKGKLVSKNFYVTVEEGYMLELDDEKREIYRDITTLVNGIEDLSIENINLKKILDKLRKTLNTKLEIISIVNTIKDQINYGGLTIDLKQKELLDSILYRLENEDTLMSVGISDYERNKMEILALLPDYKGSIKNIVEGMFKEFEENSDNQVITPNEQEKKAKKLQSIWNTIINEGKKNKREYYNESDFVTYFCNIYDYYGIDNTNKCSH